MTNDAFLNFYFKYDRKVDVYFPKEPTIWTGIFLLSKEDAVSILSFLKNHGRVMLVTTEGKSIIEEIEKHIEK